MDHKNIDLDFLTMSYLTDRESLQEGLRFFRESVRRFEDAVTWYAEHCPYKDTATEHEGCGRFFEFGGLVEDVHVEMRRLITRCFDMNMRENVADQYFREHYKKEKNDGKA